MVSSSLRVVMERQQSRWIARVHMYLHLHLVLVFVTTDTHTLNIWEPSRRQNIHDVGKMHIVIGIQR